MKYIVFVRSINDPIGMLSIEDGQVKDSGESTIINPWDLYAIEAAVQCKEKYGGEIIALSIGTDHSKKSLRRALALGCDQAIYINCSDNYFYDSTLAAHIIMKAIELIGKPDLIFAGNTFSDVNNSIIFGQLSRLLDYRYISQVTKLISLDSENQIISVSRRINGIKEMVQTKSPIILTIDKELGEPRYPSFIALQIASKSQIIEYPLEEISLIVPRPGLKFLDVETHELGKTHCEFIRGNTSEEIANNLIDVLKSRGII